MYLFSKMQKKNNDQLSIVFQHIYIYKDSDFFNKIFTT
jgi:hypothetical protein